MAESLWSRAIEMAASGSATAPQDQGRLNGHKYIFMCFYVGGSLYLMSIQFSPMITDAGF
jgi:hypothetical protein